MQYTMIVPPKIETSLTGFAMAAEKIIGKTLWRIEYWLGEKYPTVYRDGKMQASLCICPPSVIKFGNAVTKQFNQMQNMAREG